MRQFGLLLVAFAIIISSCSKTISIKPEKVGEYTDRGISKVVSEAKILSVVKKDNDTVIFVGDGADFKTTYSTIEGTSLDHGEFIENVYQLKAIIIASRGNDNLAMSYDPWEFVKLSNSWSRFLNKVTVGEMEFELDKYETAYNKDSKMIEGEMESGDPVSIDPSILSRIDVSSLERTDIAFYGDLSAGISHTMITGDPAVNFYNIENMTKYDIGLMLYSAYNKKFAFGIGLEHHKSGFSKTADFNYGSQHITVDQKINMSYISVPVVVKVNGPRIFGGNSEILAGPSFDYALSATNAFDSTAYTPSIFETGLADNYDIPNHKKSSVSGMLGCQFLKKIGGGNLILGIKYRFQVSGNNFEDINEEDLINLKNNELPMANASGNSDKLKLNMVTITIGYRFGL